MRDRIVSAGVCGVYDGLHVLEAVDVLFLGCLPLLAYRAASDGEEHLLRNGGGMDF